tara:strand:+ start:3395 stop:3814 length:420 start_codon:yes stop_codon:yes gene_type:complete
LATTSATSQELDPSVQREANLGTAAFECASLAATAGGLLDSEANRLAEVGYSATLAAMESLRNMLSQDDSPGLGSMGPFMSGRTADFLAGMSFAEANRKIRGYLDSESPYELGSDFDNWQALRGIIAENEFNRRNCSLL